VSWNGTPPAATGEAERAAAIRFVEAKRAIILRQIPGLIASEKHMYALTFVDGILQALRFGDHLDEGR
jgi:hypothetical protein